MSVLIYCLAGTVHPESFYNQLLPVVPIGITDLVCTGNETTLSECFFNIYNDNECVHINDVIVNCNRKLSIK